MLKLWFLKKRKIILVLGSGAARGLAHIGVIKALEEAGIKPDVIVGSSMGALVGAYYARWGEIKSLEEFARKEDIFSLLKLADFNLISVLGGLVKGQQIEKLLDKLLGRANFNQLKIPLIVTATDIYKGVGITINSGRLSRAVRASISIPAIFSPVSFKGRILVDGGITHPLPVSLAKSFGKGIIIASNVLKANLGSRRRQKALVQQAKILEALPSFYSAKKLRFFDASSSLPNIFQVIIQSFYAMEYELIRRESQRADVFIDCGVEKFGAFEFHRAKEIIPTGYKAAKLAINKKSQTL